MIVYMTILLDICICYGITNRNKTLYHKSIYGGNYNG